ncbi:MAG: hypothetical protein M5U33_03370 [Pseudorhodoplanes sp.]|nr:hypothetical protein [Pseudorhodoplanes sp.]
MTIADREAMFARIGRRDHDLFADVPKASSREGVGRPAACGRASPRSSACCRGMARKNVSAGSVPFFVGGRRLSPLRARDGRPPDPALEFLTSTRLSAGGYPGTLQVLFEFQTQVANLTGMKSPTPPYVRRLDRQTG